MAFSSGRGEPSSPTGAPSAGGAITLTRPVYEAGTSVMTVLSCSADRIDVLFEHGVLRFFTTKEARRLRAVCREFLDNVSVTPWDDMTTRIGREYVRIGRSIALWRECFPVAIAANVSMRDDLSDRHFRFFRGLHRLDISQEYEYNERATPPNVDISDAAFAHLQGIRTLTMQDVRQLAITDAAFVFLRGVERLDIAGCKLGITRAAFQQLRGISALNVPKEIHPLRLENQELTREVVFRRLQELNPMWINAQADGQSLLHEAMDRHGLNDYVRRLLELGADPRAYDTMGREPLHLACAHGHLDRAIALISFGADDRAPQMSSKGSTRGCISFPLAGFINTPLTRAAALGPITPLRRALIGLHELRKEMREEESLPGYSWEDGEVDEKRVRDFEALISLLRRLGGGGEDETGRSSSSSRRGHGGGGDDFYGRREDDYDDAGRGRGDDFGGYGGGDGGDDGDDGDGGDPWDRFAGGGGDEPPYVYIGHFSKEDMADDYGEEEDYGDGDDY